MPAARQARWRAVKESARVQQKDMKETGVEKALLPSALCAHSRKA